MKFLGQKETSEMSRVMQNIAQVEGEIQQKLLQLGQMYYADHKDSNAGEEKYDTVIAIVRKLDQNRNGFYQNKLRLEGKMMCMSCGAVIPYGSRFCCMCGKKADEKQGNAGMDAGAGLDMEADVRRCANCGAVLEADSMFCTSCGQKVGI